MIYFIGDINRIESNNGSIASKSIDSAIYEILGNSLICEDTETRGLDFTNKDQVILIQIGTKEDQYLFCVEDIDVKKLAIIMDNKKIEKILANIAFERNMLRSIGLVINNTFDVLLAGRVLRQGREERKVDSGDFKHKYSIYSVAGMYKEYLNIDISKEEQSSFLHYKGKFTLSQLLYAAKDVEMFDLYEDITRRLFKYDLLRPGYNLTTPIMDLINSNELTVTVLEQKVSLYFADMVYNGIYIDAKELLNLHSINLERRRSVERELNEYVIGHYPEYTGYYIEPLREEKIVQYSLFSDEADVSREKKTKKNRINWGSQQQVKPIIFNEVGTRVVDKHGKETIDIKVLAKPRYSSNPLVAKYIEYKQLTKLITSYGENYLVHINKNTNRVHANIKQVLDTGRVAILKPNLAQIPGGEEWRKLFKAMPGRSIVGADYSGQESQVMADKSKDEVFIEFFKYGDGDSHSMVASKVYSAKEGRNIVVKAKSIEVEVKNDDIVEARIIVTALFPGCDTIDEVRKDGYFALLGYDSKGKLKCPIRQKGKVLNFFISFGGSAYTLKDAEDISLEEAQDLLNGFWKGFPRLKIYFDEEKEKALKQGYILVNSVSKRKRWLPMWKDYRIYEKKKQEVMKELIRAYGTQQGKDEYFSRLRDRSSGLYALNRQSAILKGDIEREAMNTGIQGTAADMTKTAEVLLMERLEEDGLNLIDNIRPVNHVHDELALEVDDAFVDYSKAKLKECMEDASRVYCTVLTIAATPYSSDHWEH